MANDTYIILCTFEQGDLTTLGAGGQELEDKAAALNETLESKVGVQHIYLTHGGAHQAVLIVTAPSEELARGVLGIFEGIGEPEATVLTVDSAVPDNVVQAFLGHTNI
ncbi:MAG: hypothetical protein QOG56_1971 [Solirubrobacteraceae bacterium]|jgi:hypothetical protein|nr:hypothetical protein [Solirubrobacteraceae bacterium]